MPPETSSEMRSPRSSSGIGVLSKGIPVGLSLALSGFLDERQDLCHGSLEIVVYYHVRVVRRVGHLGLGNLAARRHVVRSLAVAQLLAPHELLRRWRDDEDEEPLRSPFANLLRALHLDLQNDVVPSRAGFLDTLGEGSVQVAVVGRVLEERAILDQPL